MPNFRELFYSKGLKIGSIGSLGIKFFGALTSLAVSILLARFLGLRGYGVYVLVLSIITLLTIPLTMGLPLLILRYIPKYELENDKAAIKGLMRKSHLFILLSYLVIALIFVVIYFIFKDQLYRRFVETFAMGLLLLPILGYSEVGASTIRGLRYIIPGQLPGIFLRSLFLLLGILGYILIFDELTPQAAMATHAISALFSYAFIHWILRKKLLHSLRGITPRYETRIWVKESLQFTGNMGVNKLKTRLSTYILAALGGPVYVGLYEVALKGSNMVIFGLTAVNSALGPFISRFYAKDDRSGVQHIITKATRVIFLFALPVALVFIIGGTYIIDLLYGEEFAGSYLPLVILCLGQLFNAAAGSVALLLKMTGNQKFVLRVNAINTFVNLFVAIPLVMYYNVVGAAAAYGLLIVVQNVILWMYAKRKLNINTSLF